MYLGDKLNAGAECSIAVTVRARAGWKKFKAFCIDKSLVLGGRIFLKQFT